MFQVFLYLAVIIVSGLIVQALTPKPAQPKPASLDDFSAPTAEEGRAIPVVFGTAWITGPNVVWFGDLRTTPIRAKGGKK